MTSIQTKPTPAVHDQSNDDYLYQQSAFQFTADRLGTLVRIAERDPKHQTVVSMDTLNKIHLAYLGALEIAQEQTKAALEIDGKSFLCSRSLQQAITPVLEENYRRIGEEEVLRDMAAIRSAPSPTSKGTSFGAENNPAENLVKARAR